MQSSKQHEVLVSLADILRLLREKKRFLILVTLLFSFCGFYFALTRPILYVAEATFRDKTTSPNAGLFGQAQFLIGEMLGSGNNSGATGVICSRRVMSKVVQALCLHATLSEVTYIGSWKNFQNNIKLLRSSDMFDDSPPPDVLRGIACQQVEYNLPTASEYRLQFNADDSYQLYQGKKHVGQFNLGETVTLKNLQFQIEKKSSRELKGRQFSLHFSPVENVAAELSAAIKVSTDKSDKSILVLTYRHPNRYIAANILNQLMISYKDFLEEENQATTNEQITYLEKRQKVMDEKLDALLKEYSSHLRQRTVEEGGFIKFESDMSLMARQQGELRSRRFDIELELAILTSTNHEVCVQNGESEDELGLFRALFSERKRYMRERDMLLVTMEQEGSISSGKTAVGISEELQQQQEHIKELDQLLVFFNEAKSDDVWDLSKVLSSPLVPKTCKEELAILTSAESEGVTSTLMKRRGVEQYLSAFIASIMNQKRIAQIQYETLQDRSIGSRSVAENLRGFTLDDASKLVSDYGKRRNEIQILLRHFEFAEECLRSQDLEVDALGNALKADSISQDLVSRVSDILAKIHDEHNVSAREIVRLKDDLHVCKLFLLTHIRQTREALILEDVLLRKKLTQVRQLLLDIYQQQISVLTDQLDVYRESRIQALQQEDALINRELQKLNLRIAELPDKWHKERKLLTRTELNSKVTQELARMVETKNISNNLNKAESSPLDIALPPVNPIPPRIKLYSILGAVVGAIIAVCFQVIMAIAKGVVSSPESLSLMGCRVAGLLRSKKDDDSQDLMVLRKLISFLDSQNGKSVAVSLLVGEEGRHLAWLPPLLVRKEKKVIVIDATFLKRSEHVEKEKLPLRSYLEGKNTEVQVHTVNQGYDYVYGGTYSPFGVDLLQNNAFKAYVEWLRAKYDWILIMLPVAPTSGEADALRALGDHTVVLLKNEKLHEINHYIDESLERSSFIFVEA